MIVTAAKIFSRTHTKKKDKRFADDRAKTVWEKYHSLKVVKQVPPSQDDDSLLLEAAIGWSEKGTIYGLGNSASMFYEKPIHNVGTSKTSYTLLIVSQLQVELDSASTELNSTKTELQ
uniref:Uncharacterized protein n=1 Tax=Opuntia streptacantha TaxID=393608 RepID=A0A7C9ECB2_OPUST